LRKRYAAERRFMAYGLAGAIVLTAAFLVFLVLDIARKAAPAFFVHEAQLVVQVDAAAVDAANPQSGDFPGLAKKALQARFPDVSSRSDKKALNGILSAGAADILQQRVVANPALIGQQVSVAVALNSNADLYFKGHAAGQLTEKQKAWLDALKEQGVIVKGFAWNLLLNGDSREPELAGIRGALTGSVLAIIVALGLALPLGVAAAHLS
jgi:phosphate transport system permease protein